MPLKRFPPDGPREWLNRARSNLARAKTEVAGAYLEDLCFDAQQAAEKAVKAVFIHRGIRFPYIHDLARLLSLLEQGGCLIPASVGRAGGADAFCGRDSVSGPGWSGPEKGIPASGPDRRSGSPMGFTRDRSRSQAKTATSLILEQRGRFVGCLEPRAGGSAAGGDRAVGLNGDSGDVSMTNTGAIARWLPSGDHL